jgi:hypothetical protein
MPCRVVLHVPNILDYENCIVNNSHDNDLLSSCLGDSATHFLITIMLKVGCRIPKVWLRSSVSLNSAQRLQ